MNNDFTGIHGVTDIVLGIFIDDDGGAVHESCQVIAGNTVYRNRDRFVDAITDIILSIDVVQLDGGYSGGDRIADQGVEVTVVHSLSVYFHI